MAESRVEHLKNGNFLPADGFKVLIDKFPSMGPLCQGIYVPGMMMGEAIATNPFVDYSVPGDKLVFEKMNMTLAMDENMEVFREVVQWIKGMAFPSDFNQYGRTQLKSRTLDVVDDIYSDITLMILNSKSNPNMKITYYDAFPITVGGFQLSTTDTEAPHITVDVTFTFRDWEITGLNDPIS